MNQIKIRCTSYDTPIDHSITLEQLLKAGGYDDDLSLGMLSQYAAELPVSDKQEKVSMVLFHIGELDGQYFNEPDHVLDAFSQANMRCPTKREALSFVVAHPGLLNEFEIHVVAAENKHHHLMVSTDGGRRTLFGYLWGSGPVGIAPNSCLLAAR